MYRRNCRWRREGRDISSLGPGWRGWSVVSRTRLLQVWTQTLRRAEKLQSKRMAARLLAMKRRRSGAGSWPERSERVGSSAIARWGQGRFVMSAGDARHLVARTGLQIRAGSMGGEVVGLVVGSREVGFVVRDREQVGGMPGACRSGGDKRVESAGPAWVADDGPSTQDRDLGSAESSRMTLC